MRTNRSVDLQWEFDGARGGCPPAQQNEVSLELLRWTLLSLSFEMGARPGAAVGETAAESVGF